MEVLKEKVQFQKYSDYRDSGIEWVGEAPSHWSIKKLKHIFYEKKKTTNPELNSGSISFGKVVYKDDEKITEATKSSYQEVLKGDYLINPLNLNYDLISLRIALSKINVVVSSGYIVIKNSIDLNKAYFNYLLHIFDVSYMKTLGSGVRQTLSFTHIANSELLLPPKQEQTAIASFLDEKCSKIDTAIEQKQKLIKLLKERKQIIIQNAVTKGLDPNVKMKDSGVEWIGEIPEHWEVKRLKNVCSINLNTLPETTSKSYEFQYVDIGSVTFEKGITATETYKFKSAPSRARRIARTGDTVISTVRTYLKAIDFITDEKVDYIYSTGFAILAPNSFIYPEYLALLVKSNSFTDQVTVNSKGMSYPAINSTDLSNLFVVHSDYNTQKNIVKYIKEESFKLEKSIDLNLNQIKKLKEYKSSLIDAAVTGKIKVTKD